MQVTLNNKPKSIHEKGITGRPEIKKTKNHSDKHMLSRNNGQKLRNGTVT